jgi:predicted RNA-binding Zn-ribbon protein involved in translation (DUF1610 family)
MKGEDKKANEPKTFHSGDHVKPGSYVCTACAHRVSIESEGILPPCPECYNEKFKR